jgi:prolyl-tRNA editing enzyme YbaK/EbsC (Cys-tRNA(Pro) deacylase)
MPSSAVERLTAHAAALGVTVTATEFPHGTRTASDAAAAVGCPVDAIVKSLVFVADGRPVLALTSGANRVDEARLAAAVGAQDVRRASAEEVRVATGVAIGGTPPFGHPTGRISDVLLDPALLAHPRVWAAAGTPTTVFPLSPDALVAATGARVVDVTDQDGR